VPTDAATRDKIEELNCEVIRLRRDLEDERASRLFIQEMLTRNVKRLSQRIGVLTEDVVGDS
jgi:hypothetical protein